MSDNKGIQQSGESIFMKKFMEQKLNPQNMHGSQFCAGIDLALRRCPHRLLIRPTADGK